MARAYLNLFNFTKLVYNLQDRYEGPQGGGFHSDYVRKGESMNYGKYEAERRLKSLHSKSGKYASRLLLNIFKALFVLFLFLVSSYHSCPQDNLHDYHVTDVKLCETLVDNRSFW